MRDKSQLVLPIETEILIEKSDSVYQLHEICKKLDYTKLYETYVRSWRKVDPSTMFEIMVFSYMKGIYSGRQIEEACKNDIRFMWLLDGEPAPSHATISRFQEERLSEVIEELFYQLIEVLFELGEVKFENIFVDGTKKEANANPTDVQTLIPFMERIYKNTKRRFGRVIADAGYESIENYLYLKEYGQKCFIKPQNYENSKKRSYRSNKYIAENLPYDKVLKQDKGFRRFLTRGKKNIETQFFILAFAFNIQKLYYRKNSGRFGIDLFTSDVS